MEYVDKDTVLSNLDSILSTIELPFLCIHVYVVRNDKLYIARFICDIRNKSANEVWDTINNESLPIKAQIIEPVMDGSNVLDYIKKLQKLNPNIDFDRDENGVINLFI